MPDIPYLGVVTAHPIIPLVAGFMLLLVPRLLVFIAGVGLIAVGCLGLWPDLISHLN